MLNLFLFLNFIKATPSLFIEDNCGYISDSEECIKSTYCAWCNATNFFNNTSNFMDVFLIFVSPKFRRRGIAKNFLKEIKKFCKLHLINKIILEVNEDNQAANILYQKFGFKIVGKRKDYYFMNEKKSDAIVMELNL